VHHAPFPKAQDTFIDTPLEDRMQLAQGVSSLVLSLRKKMNIKVRQPLQKILIPVDTQAMQSQLQKIEELILSEVNVKEIQYLFETEGFIKKRVKPNFQALGKKLGHKMKVVTVALSELTQNEITVFEKEGRYSLPVDQDTVELVLEDVEIVSEDIPGWMVANKGSLTVALDIEITDELVQEGEAREFVNRIQRIRKDNGLELTDRIDVKVSAKNGINESLTRYNNYICAEILADSLTLETNIDEGMEVEVNDNILKVIVLKKG
jgi:isoleucyl-tRNA synthetase